MRKVTIAGASFVTVSVLFLAAVYQDPGRLPLKYGDRLQPLIGKRFGIPVALDRATQYDNGDYTLVAVGVDYAEFKADDRAVIVPLAALRVMFEVKK